MNNKLFFGFLFCQFISSAFCGAYERKLMKDLLQDYEPYERPVFNESDPVDVKHGISINKLDLDVEKEILTGHIWMNMEWNDFNLRWNPSDYGGIKDIRLPADRIWIPDIIPYNAYDYRNVAPRKQITNIVIRSSGACTWIPPILLKTSCNIDYTTYRQSCTIKVGSWTYNGFKLNLTLLREDSLADTSSFVRNKEWFLKSAKAERNEVFYECCEEPYLDIKYEITLDRRGKAQNFFLIMNVFRICLLYTSDAADE